jgi:hypothetical protein
LLLPFASEAEGILLMVGQDGVKKDQKRALELFTRACSLHKDACTGRDGYLGTQRYSQAPRPDGTQGFLFKSSKKDVKAACAAKHLAINARGAADLACQGKLALPQVGEKETLLLFDFCGTESLCQITLALMSEATGDEADGTAIKLQQTLDGILAGIYGDAGTKSFLFPDECVQNHGAYLACLRSGAVQLQSMWSWPEPQFNIFLSLVVVNDAAVVQMTYRSTAKAEKDRGQGF